MSESGSPDSGARRRDPRHPKAGNYYISTGTWLCHRLGSHRRFGVVAEILDIHECGTLKIQWYSGTAEYCSARSFRHKLRTGRYAIDESQHPYDKVHWETAQTQSPSIGSEVMR